MLNTIAVVSISIKTRIQRPGHRDNDHQ